MVLEVEDAGSGSVHGDEPLHPKLASTDWLVRDLGPVVLSPALLKARRQTDLTESDSVGPSLSVVTCVGAKPCFLNILRMSLRAAALSRRRWMSSSRASAEGAAGCRRSPA